MPRGLSNQQATNAIVSRELKAEDIMKGHKARIAIQAFLKGKPTDYINDKFNNAMDAGANKDTFKNMATKMEMTPQQRQLLGASMRQRLQVFDSQQRVAP